MSDVTEPVPTDEEGVLERVRAAIVSVPGVAGLHSGAFGEVATYLPGERLVGIRRTKTGIDVHITALFGYSLSEVAENVRRAGEPVANALLFVTIEDVVEAAGAN